MWRWSSCGFSWSPRCPGEHSPELCGSLRPYLKRHHVQTGVAHYGVFNGQRWKNAIYPTLTNVIYASD